MGCPDWDRVRMEYVTGTETYKDLSKRMGVSQAILGVKASKEEWVKQRKQYRKETVDRAYKDISRAHAESIVKSAKLLDQATELLASNIFSCLQSGEPIAPRDAESYGRALKSIHDVLGVKTSDDQREQEARIAKLKKEADTGTGEENGGGVVILPEVLPETEEGAVHV